MIPKIIHYCWFGGNPLPDDAIKCIDSWKKYLPDYEIKEWNESNFDLSCCDYVREAYEAKKWAFVSDYVRLWAMVEFGGVYMDTDVEVLKSLDPFLELHAFSGFEGTHMIPTGIMACEKGFKLFSQLLEDYKVRHFVNTDGSYDTTTNTITITEACLKRGLIQNNKSQTIEGFTLYPWDYFCAKDYKTGVVQISENTYTVHHFSGSWLSKNKKKRNEIYKHCIEKYGVEKGHIYGKVANFPYRIIVKLEDMNLVGAIKSSLKKISKELNADKKED